MTKKQSNKEDTRHLIATADRSDEPRTYCVVKSEWERFWNKSTPTAGTRVFVVKDFDELPKNANDWYKMVSNLPFYYEFDGAKWIKRKELANGK